MQLHLQRLHGGAEAVDLSFVVGESLGLSSGPGQGGVSLTDPPVVVTRGAGRLAVAVVLDDADAAGAHPARLPGLLPRPRLLGVLRGGREAGGGGGGLGGDVWRDGVVVEARHRLVVGPAQFVWRNRVGHDWLLTRPTQGPGQPGDPVREPARPAPTVVGVLVGAGGGPGLLLHGEPLHLERSGLRYALQRGGGGTVEVVADVVQDGPQHLQLRVLLVVLRDLAHVLHQDGVEVGHVAAQVALVVPSTAQSVDPVFRGGARHQLQELLHIGRLLVQEGVHELHTVLFPLIPSKIRKCLHGLGNECQVSVGFLIWKFVSQIEEVWPQDGGAEIAEEEAAGDQLEGDLCLAHLLQVLPDLVETSLQPHRENGVRVGDPPPDDGHDVPQVLSVGVKQVVVVHFDWIHLQVQVAVQNILQAGSQRVFQVLLSDQLDVGFHRFGCDRITTKS